MNAAFTGPKATPWAGNSDGKYCTAQGNILAGEDVVKGFENSAGHLSMRSLAALEGGQKAGGDTRGMQSAAMLIVKKNGPWWNTQCAIPVKIAAIGRWSTAKNVKIPAVRNAFY